jgi:hypothetical protein
MHREETFGMMLWGTNPRSSTAKTLRRLCFLHNTTVWQLIITRVQVKNRLVASYLVCPTFLSVWPCNLRNKGPIRSIVKPNCSGSRSTLYFEFCSHLLTSYIYIGIQMVHFDHFDGAPPFKQFAFAKMRLWMKTRPAQPFYFWKMRFWMRTRPTRPLRAGSASLSELTT